MSLQDRKSWDPHSLKKTISSLMALNWFKIERGEAKLLFFGRGGGGSRIKASALKDFSWVKFQLAILTPI